MPKRICMYIMKKVFAFFFALTLLIALSSCAIAPQPDDYFGFSKQDFTVVEEEDSHNDFLGDGSYYLILDCSNNIDTALKNIDHWNQLPLSENLNLIMYGGNRDGIAYRYNLSEKAHLPVIENGYYCFLDRHSKAIDSSDDSGLFRGSFNFSLAVYDSDTNRFYYFEFDT